MPANRVIATNRPKPKPASVAPIVNRNMIKNGELFEAIEEAMATYAVINKVIASRVNNTIRKCVRWIAIMRIRIIIGAARREIL